MILKNAQYLAWIVCFKPSQHNLQRPPLAYLRNSSPSLSLSLSLSLSFFFINLMMQKCGEWPGPRPTSPHLHKKKTRILQKSPTHLSRLRYRRLKPQRQWLPPHGVAATYSISSSVPRDQNKIWQTERRLKENSFLSLTEYKFLYICVCPDTALFCVHVSRYSDKKKSKHKMHRQMCDF
jgi:hypothetical protein